MGNLANLRLQLPKQHYLRAAPLPGGFTNFVYRGTLSTPLKNGNTTVIIKHAETITRPDFTLPSQRIVSYSLFLIPHSPKLELMKKFILVVLMVN